MPTRSSAAAARNNGEWGPEDHGLLAWNYDPGYGSGSTALTTAGTVYAVKFKINKPITVTNIIISVLGVGVTLTAGQCFIGLYQGTTLLGSSADQAAAWVSATVKTTALVGGPYAVAPGDVTVGMFFNGTTGPALARNTSYSPQTNIGLAAAASRYGVADTGRTTSLPGTLGTITAGFGPNLWVGLS